MTLALAVKILNQSVWNFFNKNKNSNNNYHIAGDFNLNLLDLDKNKKSEIF